ncbi:uncharacterized protein MELLADRAFT_62728 [Melampsora larici-populina 98AG31]|uniref:Uncharacterized protein n=1 Tax=Melampsora larici-populina (strain 98AG31 / pathotype 3-4-7) TaxID=747676 RepID=F4RK00_MELLP|nr:uncharacterized protein MELLADRAFT_62728 [Melampsora larici-populina 98AG31]EGG07403.1 hypothetical protein MELLADRAFT_62728 [Melampsora larici-populina 98AG31]
MQSLSTPTQTCLISRLLRDCELAKELEGASSNRIQNHLSSSSHNVITSQLITRSTPPNHPTGSNVTCDQLETPTPVQTEQAKSTSRTSPTQTNHLAMKEQTVEELDHALLVAINKTNMVTLTDDEDGVIPSIIEQGKAKHLANVKPASSASSLPHLDKKQPTTKARKRKLPKGWVEADVHIENDEVEEDTTLTKKRKCRKDNDSPTNLPQATASTRRKTKASTNAMTFPNIDKHPKTKPTHKPKSKKASTITNNLTPIPDNIITSEFKRLEKNKWQRDWIANNDGTCAQRAKADIIELESDEEEGNNHIDDDKADSEAVADDDKPDDNN